MVWDCFERPIERPRGISGYRPAFWCVVCGRTGSQHAVRQCSKEGCPNVCHEGCLGDAAEFTCGKTGQLRAALGINDPVTPYTPPVTPSPPGTTSASTENTEEEPEDDLNNLSKEELVKVVRNLRQDLASAKSQLTNYRSVTEDLADKRQVLVEALSVVDTLLATRASEGPLHRSIACSAKPHKIDAEVNPAVLEETNPPSPSDLPHSHPSSSPTNFHPQSPSIPSSPFDSQSLSSSIPLLPNISPTLSTQHDSPSGSPPVSSPPPTQPVLPPTPPSQHATSPSGPPPLASTTPTQPNPPPIIPPQPTISTSTAPPQPTIYRDQAPRTQREATASGPRSEDDPEWQRRPRQGSQRFRKKNKPPSGGEAAVGPRLQPRRETSPRRKQTKCPQCKRHGHTRDQCPSEVCDYCQGRFHSSLTCRARLADQRQQELVQAVRLNGQETLLALRSFAWQLQQPSQIQATRPALGPPPGLPAPQSSWPVPAYPSHYGAGPYQHTALRHPGLQ